MGTETFRNIAVGTPSGNDEYIVVLIAREYDSTRTYARGDYCVKAGQAYRCINAIAAPQVWTPANWTAVYFGDELARIAREGGGGGGGGDVYPYDSNPEALGTAAPGSSDDYARGDHVHPMPTAEDVGALPDDTSIPTKTSDLTNDSGFVNAAGAASAAPVQSVNGQTGNVVLDAADVGAYTKPSTGIPASDLASAVQTSLGKADTALQTAPVTSVNGNTGAVVLSIPSTAADVGAIAAPSSPATGAFLTFNGTAWVAQTLSTWQGGSY